MSSLASDTTTTIDPWWLTNIAKIQFAMVAGIAVAYDLANGEGSYNELARQGDVYLSAEQLLVACMKVENDQLSGPELAFLHIRQGMTAGQVALEVLGAFGGFGRLRAEDPEATVDLETFLEPLLLGFDAKGLGGLARMLVQGNQIAYSLASGREFDRFLIEAKGNGFEEEMNDICNNVLSSFNAPVWDLSTPELQAVTIAYKAYQMALLLGHRATGDWIAGDMPMAA
ncbi:hypothetical protein [Aquisediminimonas profunda]|uniref:hypothetical protein n=1 Tax=Aquisediminimonas profunda TaxID=1550733 RepID=UPI001C6299DC|nr:hypothetical protein [Aquisediminimonas profunda]